MTSKSKIKPIVGLFVALTFVINACELSEDPINELTAQDLTTSILENPDLGAEIGQVIASAEGAEMEFAVVGSEPSGALSIDATNGVLKVADERFFDFETRDRITGEVLIKAGTESRRVNVIIAIEDQEANIEDFNMITKHWKTDKFSFSGVFATMDNHACRLDDKMSLSGTGNYSYDGGAELCGNEDNQQLKTGTWDLDEHLQFLIFDKGTESEFRVDIDFFSADKISLSGSWMGISVSGEFIPE